MILVSTDLLLPLDHNIIREGTMKNKKSSPEYLNNRINEVYSMITESVGKDSLSEIVPNWKNTKMQKITEDIVESVIQEVNQDRSIEESYYPDTPEWRRGLTKYGMWSPKWARSKFAVMSPEELKQYAGQSPENRKELRDIMEREYKYMLRNAKDGMFKRMNIRDYNKAIERGEDPHDTFGRMADNPKTAINIFLKLLPLIIQLIIYIFLVP